MSTSTETNTAPEMTEETMALSRTMLRDMLATFTLDECVESLLGLEANAAAEHPELFRDAYLERIQSGFPDAYEESMILADELGISRLDALVVLAAEAQM